MKIAAIVNESGDVVNSYENAYLSLYEDSPDGWVKRNRLLLDVRADMGLVEVKAYLKTIFAQLNGCEIFVLRELRGLVYVLLQEMGFRIWKSEGSLAEQLECVARKESENCNVAEESTPAPVPAPAPEPVGDIRNGHYMINLAEALDGDSGLNSRQILIPFMESLAFKKLEILCDHVPRWFSKECEQLNLVTESKAIETPIHGLLLTISPKTGKDLSK